MPAADNEVFFAAESKVNRGRPQEGKRGKEEGGGGLGRLYLPHDIKARKVRRTSL